MLMQFRFALRLIACFLAAWAAHGSQIIRESLSTSLVSAGAVEYAILLPDSYSPDGERFPLLLLLHGAGGDREKIARIEPQISEMWASNDLPRMVVVTPSIAAGSIYLDSYDGTERWESFLMDEFLPHLRAKYRVSRGREKTMVSGGSMGGIGSLRLGFKHPETFGAIAAMQPAVWPGVTWDEVPDRNKIRPPERIANLFGDPFDDKRFLRENPASIVERDPSRLLGSAIYIEVGEQDGFGFVEGADFIHRLLWHHRIPHEFRLVRWADHVGSTMTERSRDRFRFLARYLEQPTAPEPAVERFRERMAERHRSRGLEPFGFWPNPTLRSYGAGDGLESLRAVRDSKEVRAERGVIRIADVPYARNPETDPLRQSMDIYIREGLSDAPAVLYVHGGGWIRGDKERALFKPAFLVPKGYLFASMNYRFRPEASLAEMAADVASAAVWLKQHASKYGGDGARITLMGHSAGGHLVALVGANQIFMEDAGGSLSDLAGVVVIDSAMLNVPARMETAGQSQTRVFGSAPEGWIPVSPWHHVEAGKGIPPYLLFTSDGRAVSQEQAAMFTTKLDQHGIEASSHEGKGRAHTPLDTYMGVEGDASTGILLDFLRRHTDRP
ncbi:MAG: alpha/beta hydrolase fold domain-containing protein [Acidobacteriia bacterium]|nr:alpha/beta hydrolase fold domain-containing protein [Terriglobia bacterium]MYK10104.1 alpha/beta hydrolase fold domain-containing protein [Terriglobia bacterium]